MIGKTALALCASLAFASLAHAEDDRRERIPVRVVVVTAFEIGNDTGDTPGEFQNWVEKLPLPNVVPFPQGYHPLRYNPEKHVLGIVAGEGSARMASSITALANVPASTSPTLIGCWPASPASTPTWGRTPSP